MATVYTGDSRCDNNTTARRFARGNRNKTIDQLAACGWTKTPGSFEYRLQCGPVVWSMYGNVHDQQWIAKMLVNGSQVGDEARFDYGTSFDVITDRCIDAAADYLNDVIDAERADSDPVAMDLDFGDIGSVETDW